MKRKVIVNADDLGYDPAVTRGILRAMRAGVVTSATFMVNTPWSAEAATASEGLSLGLHLNLARGMPVWSGFPASLLADGALGEPSAPTLPPEVVARETEAQLDRFAALLGRSPTHIDVHKHLHQHPAVLEGLSEVARARGLPVRSIDAPMRALLRARGVRTNDGFIGDAGTEAYWTLPRLAAELATVPPEGITELMCHPGYAPSQVRSGYAGQRETELATFTSAEAWPLFERAGIERCDWRAVK